VRETIESVAIKYLKESFATPDIDYNVAEKHSDILQMAIEALEKQIPMKLGEGGEELTCLNCGKDVLNYYVNYCECCGQKLDWEVSE